MRGTFEAHLTVDATTAERRAEFAALCAKLGVKCVLIELARGAHPSQPMTSSHHTGDSSTIHEEVRALERQITEAGFVVTRVKIEADVTNEGVDEALAGTYFEFHAKLHVTGDEVDALRALCVERRAHLSRNEIERGARFVTLRVYDAGRERAAAEFGALVDALVGAGHAVMGMKAELTIYDSRVELDAGWLP